MICAIGIDSVDIARFKHWNTYLKKTLFRVFSKKEIEYCLQYKNLSAQRFAARFAVKEAFLKAISSAYPEQYFSLFKVCKNTSVCKNPNGSPRLIVDWPQLTKKGTPLKTHLSLTHTATTASAIVVVEQSIIVEYMDNII